MLKKKTFEELFLETYTPVLHKNVLSNQDKFWSSVEIVKATASLTETNEKGKLQSNVQMCAIYFEEK